MSTVSPPSGLGYIQTGLNMASYDTMMDGTVFGVVIIPGDSKRSVINKLVEGRDKQLVVCTIDKLCPGKPYISSINYRKYQAELSDRDIACDGGVLLSKMDKQLDLFRYFLPGHVYFTQVGCVLGTATH